MNTDLKTRSHDPPDLSGPSCPDPGCLKLISYLLQYPDEEFLTQLSSLKAVLAAWPDAAVRRGLEPFIQYLAGSEPLQLQEAYTAAFDLTPATSMNLTYHLGGDDEKRGRMLAQLQQIYRQEGYESGDGDLPDYLPLLLEFYSQQPHWIDYGLSRKILATLKPLAARLAEDRNPYAAVFEIVARQLAAKEDRAPQTNTESNNDVPEIQP